MRPKLEVAPKSNNKLTYDEAVMYCFFLDFNGKGWRIPAREEYIVHNDRLFGCWYEGREQKDKPLRVKPVRDVNTSLQPSDTLL